MIFLHRFTLSIIAACSLLSVRAAEIRIDHLTQLSGALAQDLSRFLDRDISDKVKEASLPRIIGLIENDLSDSLCELRLIMLEPGYSSDIDSAQSDIDAFLCLPFVQKNIVADKIRLSAEAAPFAQELDALQKQMVAYKAGEITTNSYDFVTHVFAGLAGLQRNLTQTNAQFREIEAQANALSQKIGCEPLEQFTRIYYQSGYDAAAAFWIVGCRNI